MGPSRLEPEKILQVCQAQVAEVEQWLDKTKVSLKSDPQTPKMQHAVEMQLAYYQVRQSRRFTAAIHTSCTSLRCVSAEKRCSLLLFSPLNRLHYTMQKTCNCLASVSGAALQGLS